MKIKVGVVGARRGMSFIKNMSIADMQLTALCEKNPEKFNESPKTKNITVYENYDEFLQSDIDAVILANYFHEHTPLAVKALNAGKHVMSECQAAVTMSECVELVEAVESSGKIYMLAENYPYFAYTQEMKRLYEQGEIGTIQYAEGEYIHPDYVNARLSRSRGFNHWRNNLPATYYCSHSLAPIMYVSDTIPKSVNALVIPKSFDDFQTEKEIYTQDRASVILVRMNNESVVRLLQNNLRGHGNWYSIHGTSGLMENLRVEGEKDKLRIFHDDIDMKEGMVKEKIYTPTFNQFNEAAGHTGHGGGDFFTLHHFFNAIKDNKQPYLDVYKATTMAAVGIQSFKSALENGAPYPIPDFKDIKQRDLYRNDSSSPFVAKESNDWINPSVYKYPEISKEAKENASKIWRETGYCDTDM